MTAVLDRVVDRSPDDLDTARTPVRARTFRPDIEGMRALAVVAVVLYHARLGVPGGYVGVDVFFVISGFLITRQLTETVGVQGLRALPSFYARRVKRLLPAAATVVVVTVAAARIWAPAVQVPSIARDGLFTTFYGLNFRLAVEGTQYLHQNDSASPLLHFWSLCVEEQFYVVWPVLIVITAWIGRRHRNRVLFVTLAAVAAASFYGSVTITKTSAPWAYFSLPTRAWELALGAMVALGAQQLARIPRPPARAAGWLGLLVIVASAFRFNDSTAYPGSLDAVPVLGAALIIAVGCGKHSSVERLLREPLLQCLGRVSYSWYLWHWPMLVLVPVIVGHPLAARERIGLVWLSLVFGLLSYTLIENPSRHAARRTWQGLGMGVVVSGAVAAATVLVIANPPSSVGTGAAVKVVQARTATPAVIQRMRTAVATGVGVTNAPSNLTPAVARAAKDLPAADGTNCHAEFATIHQGACVYGYTKGTHTAVIVGDSHADMWLPAFAQAGVTKHWKIVDWTKSACPAADITVFSSVLHRTYTECNTWRASVLKRIAALKPDRVFVSDSEEVADAGVTPQQWSSATVRTLQTLRKTTGARVTLLQDIPTPAYNVPSCVGQHLTSVTRCTFATSKGYRFPARHQQLATDAARAGFAVIEPRSWICTATTCPAIVGNILVYRDDSHLSATFSHWLAPMVARSLTVPRKGR